MQLEIISFDGSTIINDGINFRGSIPEGGAGGLSLQPPEASFAARTGQFPKLAAMRGREKYLAMKFEVLDQSQMLAKRDVLAGIFDASETSGELKTLVVSDGGSEWQLEGVVVGFSFDAALGSATVVFAAPDPVWRSVIQNTDTWNITASGQTRSISTEGNTTALPYFEIKPTGVRSGNGMSYRRFVEVINPMRHNFRGALNLANGEISNGLDTAALTTAKMQADGDDLQVRVDGQNCDRWLQDMDTGSTEIWIRLNLKAGISVSLGAAIPASGEISMIELEDTPANMNRIKRMPQAGQVRVGSEYFCYQGKDVQELKLLDIKRSAFGSAKAAHSTGETVIWIEHRIWLVYGDPDAGPANSEEAANLQPVFRLDSENERLDFDVFSTENGGRQGEWEGQLKFRRPAGRTATGEPGETTLYSASAESNADNPDWSDPGTHLGQQLRPVREGAEYLRTRASLWWSFYHPAGITAVTVSGRKFAADCSHWPRVELLYSSNGSDWQVKWSEPV
ncbi:MAG: hypothetical protein OEY93_11370, partial [Anaerolineae bacterium]|nr:hypothetical protein [Anaerolineae bacterium]